MESSSIFSFIALILIILVAMTVHEAVHAYVGLRLGDTTAQEEGRVSLNPLRHIDPLMTVLLPAVVYWQFHVLVLAAKPVPFNPFRVRYGEYGAALIAAAGPLSNLVMAMLGAFVLHTGGTGVMADITLLFVDLNVSLFVFNMVPIPPLDGSRVLYAFAPEAVQDVMRQLEPYGFFIIVALVFVTGFGTLLLNINQAVLHLLVGV